MHPLAEAWKARGSWFDLAAGGVFVVDEEAVGSAQGPPALLLHGFPTCSFDWHQVWEPLRAGRRLVALDLPGYGLSAKVDRPHPIEGQADTVIEVVRQLGLDEVDLVTHDMGDTVGGALLARSLDGELPFGVRRRVVTNGSIHIHMAGLRWQQKALLALPDRRLPVDLPSVMYTRGLARIYGRGSPPEGELAALWDLFRHERGNRLVARLIRYIEERRQHERRWTGAIERHPAPLGIIWGDADPVAVAAMATKLHEARPDAELTWLAGVGHFPMTEAPAAFAGAVIAFLDGT